MKRTLVTAAVTGLMVLGGSPAMAAPPADGCPRGYQLWDVTTEPYQADDNADENGDGLVCARRLGEGTSRPYGGAPVYVFGDNDLAASS